MRDYNKEKEIEEIFAFNRFSESEYVVGTGATFSKKNNSPRFEFNAGNRRQIIEKTAIFAVKYFSEHNFYILWRTCQKTTKTREVYRTCFSVDAFDALQNYELNQKARKGVDFKWRLQEDVIVADLETLKQIIGRFSTKEISIK